jgi:hypothetical protein
MMRSTTTSTSQQRTQTSEQPSDTHWAGSMAGRWSPARSLRGEEEKMKQEGERATTKVITAKL